MSVVDSDTPTGVVPVPDVDPLDTLVVQPCLLEESDELDTPAVNAIRSGPSPAKELVSQDILQRQAEEENEKRRVEREAAIKYHELYGTSIHIDEETVLVNQTLLNPEQIKDEEIRTKAKEVVAYHDWFKRMGIGSLEPEAQDIYFMISAINEAIRNDDVGSLVAQVSVSMGLGDMGKEQAENVCRDIWEQSDDDPVRIRKLKDLFILDILPLGELALKASRNPAYQIDEVEAVAETKQIVLEEINPALRKRRNKGDFFCGMRYVTALAYAQDEESIKRILEEVNIGLLSKGKGHYREYTVGAIADLIEANNQIEFTGLNPEVVEREDGVAIFQGQHKGEFYHGRGEDFIEDTMVIDVMGGVRHSEGFVKALKAEMHLSIEKIARGTDFTSVTDAEDLKGRYENYLRDVINKATGDMRRFHKETSGSFLFSGFEVVEINGEQHAVLYSSGGDTETVVIDKEGNEKARLFFDHPAFHLGGVPMWLQDRNKVSLGSVVSVNDEIKENEEPQLPDLRVQVVKLDPGDCVLSYTDGIGDTSGTPEGAFLIRDVVRSYPDGSSSELVSAIVGEVAKRQRRLTFNGETVALGYARKQTCGDGEIFSGGADDMAIIGYRQK